MLHKKVHNDIISWIVVLEMLSFADSTWKYQQT